MELHNTRVMLCKTYTVFPAKTPQNVILCLLHFPEYSAQSQGAYQNDHQPSLILMVVLKVKDIASRETEGCVYTDDFRNTLGSAFLKIY